MVISKRIFLGRMYIPRIRECWMRLCNCVCEEVKIHGSEGMQTERGDA